MAETMSYYFGGLILATLRDGLVSGVRQCIKPRRYMAFLPAAAAFSTSNFLTYVAVRGLGASQFYLLAQLRIGILALILRFWRSVRQPVLAWLALVQLAAGMVVLVWYQASTGVNCGTAVGAIWSSVNASAEGDGAADMLNSTQGEATIGAAVGVDGFFGGVVALFGVVLSSAFGFLYLEWQLKSNAQDPLFVQLHQMNSFAAGAAFVIHLRHVAAAPTAGEVAAASAAASAAALAAAGNASAATFIGQAPPGTEQLPSGFLDNGTVCLVACVLTRGFLSGSVLKHLDAIAKGLIDVTAIVLCTGLQVSFVGAVVDGTAIGIQGLMLMSVGSYIVARAPTWTIPPPTPCRLDTALGAGTLGASTFGATRQLPKAL
jgi:hypothetical protein